jgi:hypothetical protein
MFKKSLTFAIHVKRLPVAVVLGLVLVCADLAHGQQRLPDCYVLSVGIDNYTHVGKLKGDVNDARNTSAAFTAQQGKLFGKVMAHTLLDDNATRFAISKQVQALEKVGKAGDYVVLFFSGHGGIFKDTRTWYFVPCDYHPHNSAVAITDRQLLNTADRFVRQGKKVLIIVDACFSGQLRVAAQPYLVKYGDPQGGGLVVMVSSGPDQTSAALGSYSAFAKAFADSMDGMADLNRDGKVSLDEVRHFAGKRTYELLRQTGKSAKQDCIIAWSPSIPNELTLAIARNGDTIAGTMPAVSFAFVIFGGSEKLPGYGPLAFTLHANGSVVMADAKGSAVGTWQETGKQVTLRFDNGRVVYTGTVEGTRLSGEARNGSTTWSWSTQVQVVGRPAPVAMKN